MSAVVPPRPRPNSSQSVRKQPLPPHPTHAAAAAAVGAHAYAPAQANAAPSSSLPSSSGPGARLPRPSTAPSLSPTPGDTQGQQLPYCRQSRSVPLDAVIPNLPSLLQTPPGLARRALFAKKVRLCSHVFDLSSELPTSPKLERLRETKRSTLLELVNYFTIARPLWTPDTLPALFDMLRWNLLRPLPPNSFELFNYDVRGGHTFSPEEDAHIEDAQWPHLQICYELLLRMVSPGPPNAHTLQKLIDDDASHADADTNPYPEPLPTLAALHSSHALLYSSFLTRPFLTCLIHNFRAEDARERDYVKTILHRVYGHRLELRPFLRRTLQAQLLEMGMGGAAERRHGLAEILELLGSIINGFMVPLKTSHTRVLFRRVLLPLWKLQAVPLVFPQLSYASLQFVEKEPGTLAGVLIDALLRMWPRTNSRKEVLFIQMIEDILERVPNFAHRPEGMVQQQQQQQRRRGGDSSSMSPPPDPLSLPDDALSPSLLHALTTQLCQCVHSTHFQVSEKSITLLSAAATATAGASAGFLARFVFFAGEEGRGEEGAGRDWRRTLVPIIARAIYINTEQPLVNMLGPVPNALRSPKGSSAAAAAAAGSSPSSSPSKSKSIRPLSGKSATTAAGGAAAGGSVLVEVGEALGSGLRPSAIVASAPPSLLANGGTRGHWNPTISEMTTAIAAQMEEHDADLWRACQRQIRAEKAAAARAAQSRTTARKDTTGGVNLTDALAAVSLNSRPDTR